MGIVFRKTFIPTDLSNCWAFFSSPENLSKITPKQMSFVIKQFDGKKMYTGQRIGYTVKPLLNFPLYWLTEIKSVRDKTEFVDIQIKGPYKLWHHRHLFKETGNGTEMIDIVHYTVPFGRLGKVLEKLVIQKRIKDIFDFREQAIKNHFN